MGASSSSAADDPVVRALDFSQAKRTPAKRTPLGELPPNRTPSNPTPSPSVTATARKDESCRRAAFKQICGEVVEKAVATELAVAAADPLLNLAQLKSLQSHAQAIAMASTTELRAVADELRACHQRQLDRARRPRATVSDHQLGRIESGELQAQPAPFVVQVHPPAARVNESAPLDHSQGAGAPPPATPRADEARHNTTTPATSQLSASSQPASAPPQPQLPANGSQLEAPAPLPPPRSTPPPPTPAINVAAMVRGLDEGSGFEGPEFVKAYLSVRKEQACAFCMSLIHALASPEAHAPTSAN